MQHSSTHHTLQYLVTSLSVNEHWQRMFSYSKKITVVN